MSVVVTPPRKRTGCDLPALSGGAFLIQVLIAPRVQAKFGLHRSFMVLPFALLGGAAVLVVGGSSMMIRSGLRLTEGGLKASLHRSSWEQAYVPIKRLHRAGAKIVIDGVGPHLGEAVAAMMLWIWLYLVVGDQELVGRNVSWIAYARYDFGGDILDMPAPGNSRLSEQCGETGC